MEASYGVGPDPGRPADVQAAPTARHLRAPIEVVRRAASAPDEVLLEGVHALKHALRFGADVEVVLTPDVTGLTRLLEELAADVREAALSLVVPVPQEAWRHLLPRGLPSPALSVARRPGVTVSGILAAAGRVVVLEQPRHLGNLGAAVRVAAAAGAGGLLVVGDADPWHRTAVRAAAGLQFALPCLRVDTLPDTDRPVLALDPEGDPFPAGGLPSDALVVFGTERGGLSEGLRRRATSLVSLPMRDGVSSLNLATAVAATLYRA